MTTIAFIVIGLVIGLGILNVWININIMRSRKELYELMVQNAVTPMDQAKYLQKKMDQEADLLNELLIKLHTENSQVKN